MSSPMKGDGRADMAGIRKSMDEALPRMLRDCLKYRADELAAGGSVAAWDKQLTKIEQLCRVSGIDPDEVRREFETENRETER